MERKVLWLGLSALLATVAACAREEAPVGPQITPGPPGVTTLRWLGHAAFLLQSPGGTTILIDPFSDIGYPMPRLQVDAVAITHEHFDHSNARLGGKGARVIKGVQNGDWVRVHEQVGDVTIHAFPTYHDGQQGRQRGKNAMLLFEVGGLRILHVGDLGHVLTDVQAKAVGPVDVLLIPVGGFFTIDAQQATEVVRQLNPKIVIPMHYRTEAVNFRGSENLAGVEPFLVGKEVQRLGSNTLTLDKEKLPATTTVIVMDYR